VKGVLKSRTPRLCFRLDNAYNEQELRDWTARSRTDWLREDESVCEFKMDGMSLALILSRRQLTDGVTRGDGSVGEALSCDDEQ